MKEVIATLSEYERVILPLLLEGKDAKAESGLLDIQFQRALQWLSNKNLITLDYTKEEFVDLDTNGILYKEKGLPEKRFLEAIKDASKTQSDLNKILTPQEVGACIGLLKSKQAIEVTKEKELSISITDQGKILLDKQTPEELFLQSQFPKSVSQLDDEEKHLVSEFSKRRNIITKFITQTPVYELTQEAKKIKIEDIQNDDSIGRLTTDMIRDKSFVGKQFRPFDVESRVPSITPGRIHPMTAVIRKVEQIFTEMGFSQMKSPWVETAFWCMDSMWIPQDHPARDVQDTFYIGKKGTLPVKELVEKIIAVHENGGSTGSTGYGYKWNPELAKELILRTHTTAATYRQFGQRIKAPVKRFYVGKVFRNEAIDATHLPEFYQVEGFVVAKGLTLQHLLGFIKDFYAKLGYTKIKFKSTYNPYTEPSVEALYYDEKRKKWMELINSGIFRPESLEPYGITEPVIAWGVGLERLAMIMFEQGKLKDLIGPQSDLRWLRSYREKW